MPSLHAVRATRLRAGEPTGTPGRGRPAAGLLAGALLLALGACAPAAAPPPDPADATVDYDARHERMLEFVLERPAQWEAQRLARQRRRQRISREAWEAVMARQEAFNQVKKRQTRRGDEAFLRILERQAELEAARRESDAGERWARFVERNAPQGEAAGGDAAATGPVDGPDTP